MRLTSPAFSQSDNIPKKYTCQGKNISPELNISEVSANTKSLVLIMEDFDAWLEPHGPGKIFEHWIAFNIPPETKVIEEGSDLNNAIQLKNSGGDFGYTGPCPPSFNHLYTFRLYALNSLIENSENIESKEHLVDAMQGKVIDSTLLYGFYCKE